MAKKHRFRKPQIRKNQKKTTGNQEFVNVVYMEKEKVDNKVQIYATCTCNTWRSSPEATTITKVGLEAKAHIVASKGKCAFRYHDIPEDQDPDKTLEEASEDIAKETPI